MNNKADRWTKGTGEIRLERIQHNWVRITESNQPTCSFIRADIRRLGPRNYKIIMFQGRGHKDTVYMTNRWMNVRETIGNHLCDIDWYLKRPLTKFRLPTEDECFAPQPGDVVVFHGNFTEGDIGLVIKRGCINTSVLRWNVNYPDGGRVMVESFPFSDTSAFEVIDHDEDLLKDLDVDGVRNNPETQQIIKHDGWEYWLTGHAIEGVTLWKRCITCKSLHQRNISVLWG